MRRRQEAVWGRREREKGNRIFCFFQRSTRIGYMVFVGARGKVHSSSKAMRGYHNLGVSSREFSYLDYF